MGTCDSQRRCVFVGYIPYDVTEEQLIQICEDVGPVVSFRLVIDKETGKPKGYGFCEYKDEETALSARRNLQGYDINGRKLRVDFSENDKNSGKNREQGRGGPGMVANVDLKKHIGGPGVPVDSALQQPLGMPVAMTAAAVMAGSLGAAQSGSSFSQSGVDPLTLHMSTLSRSQLNDVMSEFKAMGTQNKEQTRQLLLTIPYLSKALFQAQLILGMVTQPMGNHSAVSGVLDNTNKESRRPQAPNYSSLITRSAYPSGLPKEKRGTANNLDLLSRPSKTARLNDGISYALPDASASTPLSGHSTQVSAAVVTSNPDKQASQLPSDVEPSLLQQVLSLTPERLSSLPPDQQKQVIQLQQMLRQPA